MQSNRAIILSQNHNYDVKKKTMCKRCKQNEMKWMHFHSEFSFFLLIYFPFIIESGKKSRTSTVIAVFFFIFSEHEYFIVTFVSG